MAEKVCATCVHNRGFDFGPSPSGPEDGVNCDSEGIVEALDWSYQEDFKEHGTVNIFRVEVIDPGGECSFWGPKEVISAPS